MASMMESQSQEDRSQPASRELPQSLLATSGCPGQPYRLLPGRGRGWLPWQLRRLSLETLLGSSVLQTPVVPDEDGWTPGRSGFVQLWTDEAAQAAA